MRTIKCRTLARRVQLWGGRIAGQNSTEHLVMLPDQSVERFKSYLAGRNFEITGNLTTASPTTPNSYYIREIK